MILFLKGYISLAPNFCYGLCNLRTPEAILSSEDWASFSNSVFSMSCITRSFCATDPHLFTTYVLICLLNVLTLLGESLTSLTSCPNSLLGCLNSVSVFLYIYLSLLPPFRCFLSVFEFGQKLHDDVGLLSFLPGGTALEFGGGNPRTLTS